MLLSVYILLILFLLAFLYSLRTSLYFKIRNIPYVQPWPFFGNAFNLFTFRENFGVFVRKLYNSTTFPILGFFVGDAPYVLIRSPQLIKHILITDFQQFNDRTITNNYKDDIMGSNIVFLSKSPYWTGRRRQATGVFTSGKFKLRHDMMTDLAHEMIEYIREGSRKGNGVMNVRDITVRFSTDVVTSTTLGFMAGSFREKESDFVKAARSVFNSGVWERTISLSLHYIAPILVKWFKMKFVDTKTAEFLRTVFWRVIEKREKTGEKRNDLIDILIRVKNDEKLRKELNLEGDRLVAQASQFYIAGTETTSSAIALTLYALAVEKSYQHTAREEIHQAIKTHGSLTYEALNDLTYLDMCIKETLRMYPSLPFLDRRCNTDYKLPETDWILEKGQRVYIPMWGLHYDPNFYPNPELYDPLRFTPENIESRPAMSYLPFGEGPRKCIGARMGFLNTKYGLAHIISQFEVDSCPQTAHPLKLADKGILIAPTSDLYLTFKKIE